MITPEDMVGSSTVKTWVGSAGLSDGDPRLGVMTEFCRSVGSSPDELIERCLRSVGEGQFKIRMAVRRELSAQIQEFAGGDHQRGNAVRSFFIHNGVALQPPTILR